MTTLSLFASDKQIAFLKDLIAERELQQEDRDTFTAALPTMEKKQASLLIDTLLKLPKRTDKVAATTPRGMLQQELAKAPKSKYAIPTEELDILLENTPLNGDLLFIEIREYMGNLYMRRLIGSLGGFTRLHVHTTDAITIVNKIAADPYKYAKLFGAHYSCCGSCGAELTDPVSRELQLGPECRKKFGK